MTLTADTLSFVREEEEATSASATLFFDGRPPRTSAERVPLPIDYAAAAARVGWEGAQLVVEGEVPGDEDRGPTALREVWRLDDEPGLLRIEQTLDNGNVVFRRTEVFRKVAAPTVRVESEGRTVELTRRFPVSSPGGIVEHTDTPSKLDLHVVADDQIRRVPSIAAFLLPGVATASGRFFPILFLLLHDEGKPDRDVAYNLPTGMERLDDGTYRYESAALQPDEIRRLCQRLRPHGRTEDVPRLYVGVTLYSGPGRRYFYPVELVLGE